MSQYRTIPLKPATYERLQNLGRKGQTWDDVINELVSKTTKGGGNAGS